MRFVIEGRLRRSCGLSPAAYFALAVREWEMVLRWLGSGVALAYGRPLSPSGGTLLVEVPSEADARTLAASLPLAPYADITVRRSDAPVRGPAGDGPATPGVSAPATPAVDVPIAPAGTRPLAQPARAGG
jgi:hypothetical protein